MLRLAVFSSSDEAEEYNVAEMNCLLMRYIFDAILKICKQAFKYVLDKFYPQLEEAKRSGSVPNVPKLSAMMYIFGEGSYQKAAGNDHNIGVSQSSVSKLFKECINAMHSEQ